ncbi:unnamed protein product [Arctia plantaginis]|uniref:BBSome complex member BBS5 PH domain-containing protein n=1 Tax=Arctia plantaginis TaxID=874455 RepID=A0A8S0ZNF3_ARCPL|nr:unnamed protein product [Arctia plantaginis]
MSKHKTGPVWEDREVLFDLPFAYLKLRPGEKIFDRIEPIEDTKGNSGTKGRMVVTNLRIIWHSMSSPRINLCKETIIYTTSLGAGVHAIGLNCILSTSTKVVNSGLRGTTQALYLLAVFKNNRYEFIFTNLSPNCVRHYTSVAGVHKYTSCTPPGFAVALMRKAALDLDPGLPSSFPPRGGSKLGHPPRVPVSGDVKVII